MSATSDQPAAGGRRHDSTKKPYRKPRIEDYGTVIELTREGAGTGSDGGDPFASSGAVA